MHTKNVVTESVVKEKVETAGNNDSRNISGQLLQVIIAVVLTAIFPGHAMAAEMQAIAVNGGEIMVEIQGTGEPVLMIHGTGVAATFSLVMSDPAFADYRIIRMHRRGFGGSSPTPVPFTIKDHAADAHAVLAALNIEKAHIVGHSFGGSVVLQFAADYPEAVNTLVVSDAALFDEPPPVFFTLSELYESGDKAAAMNQFSGLSYGQDWRTLALRVDPNGPEQVMGDVDTVFQTEVPAMINWEFGEAEAQRITHPMLYVTGSRGANASLASLQGWIDKVIEVAVIPDTTHALLMQDPAGVANAIVSFLRRHPVNPD